MRFLPAILLALWALPGTARAYEDAIVLEAGVGYVGSFGGSDTRPFGLRADLGALIGVTPALSLGFRAEGGFVRDDDAQVGFFSPVAELVYAIDIVTAVPRFAFGARTLFSTDDGRVIADLGLDLALGLDFLPRSGPNWGIELRATFLPLDRNPSLGPVLFGLGVRVGFPFER